MSLKVWPKYRFKRANERIRDCLLNLGYCATEEEMEERKEFIRLCREVVKETETVGKYPLGDEKVSQELVIKYYEDGLEMWKERTKHGR